MFRRISEPLALSEASLLALRPALNAPVLNVDYLPVGPARAAIVIFAEEYGGIGLALGIRSTEGGRVAVFRNREPIDESAPLESVLEPALASAERMGFLFDEDMVEGIPGGQGRSEATALWGRLMGDVAMPPAPKAAPPLPAATEPILDLTETMIATEEVAELVLEEVALAEPIRPSESSLRAIRSEEAAGAVPLDTAAEVPTAIEVPTAAEVPIVEAAEPLREIHQQTAISQPVQSNVESVQPPAPQLSKFRSPLPVAEPRKPVAPPVATDETSSPLGRVPLVRVRRAGDGTKRIPYLARLLSSF